MSDNNSHAGTVSSFGREWSTYDQAPIAGLESTSARFLEYFSVFPSDTLPSYSEGADVGCGSGRWALRVAPKIGTLHCIDASGEAFKVARRNLSKQLPIPSRQRGRYPDPCTQHLWPGLWR
jgi:SAM-dependent methyltransferase